MAFQYFEEVSDILQKIAEEKCAPFLDVDKMINIEQVLAKNNLANERGVNALLERMIKSGEISGDITSQTVQALNPEISASIESILFFKSP